MIDEEEYLICLIKSLKRALNVDKSLKILKYLETNTYFNEQSRKEYLKDGCPDQKWFEHIHLKIFECIQLMENND